MEVRSGLKKMGDREKKYVHMLNSTLCATGRAICCLLETYQEDDGVRIPEVLVPFMGGITFMPFVRDSKLNPLPAPTDKAAKVPKESKKDNKKEEKADTKKEEKKPEQAAVAAVAKPKSDDPLQAKLEAQANAVRQLKTEKADKATVRMRVIFIVSWPSHLTITLKLTSNRCTS